MLRGTAREAAAEFFGTFLFDVAHFGIGQSAGELTFEALDQSPERANIPVLRQDH